MASKVKLYDRVRETTVTTGTGTLTLAGAVAAFRSFSAVGNGNQCSYTIVSGTAWENGVGTYTSSGTTLSRDRVLSSSNSNNKISCTGTSDVFLSAPALLLDEPYYDAKLYGMVGDGSTDDTTAFQALIDLVGTAGGGTIFLPAGTYLIGGALQDTGNSNSQLKLPTVAITVQTVVINIIGQSPPPAQFYTDFGLPVTGFSTIKSTLTGASGTASIISGPSTSTAIGLQNNVVLNLQNIIIELPPNPTLSGVNLQYHQANLIRDVLVHCGSVDLDSLAEPTHTNQYGVIFPDYSHTAYTECTGLTVFGCYYGVRVGELAVVRAIRLWGCAKAVGIPFAYHPCLFSDVGIYWCTYGIVALDGAGDGTCRTRIALLDIERAAGLGAAWQDSVYDIDDSTNLLYGDAVWWSVSSGVGVDHILLKNGGDNLNCVELGTIDLSRPEFTSAEIGIVDDTTVAVTFNQEVKAADYKLGVTIEVDSTPATISSATRQSTKSIVYYVLSGAVLGSEDVTWEYSAIDGFIEDEGGNHLQDVSPQEVTNNIGSVGTIILDNFTDTNGTAIASHTISPTNTPVTSWTVGSGSWSVTSNAILNGSTGINIASCDSGESDCTIRVTVRRTGALPGDTAILFRYQDSSNYWIADLQQTGTDTTGTFSIWENTSGSFTERQHTAKVFTADTDFVIEVILSGTSISATVDGGSTLNHTSSVGSARTKHGMWSSIGVSASDQVSFDSFEVVV